MNFNPENREGLLGLVDALRSGLDPVVGMQLYGQIQQDQAAAIAERQERLSQYNELLTSAATSGMPYQGARSLAQALPGHMPAQAKQALNQLYPENPEPTILDQVLQRPAASGTPTTVQQQGLQSISPAIDPAVVASQQDQAMQMAALTAPPEPTAGQVEDQNFATMVTGIQTLFDKGKSPDEIRALIMQDPQFSGLFVSKYNDLLTAFPQFAGI